MNREHTFWQWFLENEEELFNFDPTLETPREQLFDRLAAQLHRVDRDLTFEFGPNGGPIREFVLSAGGIKRAFPAVTSLVAAAPPLSRWRFIAFRPRRIPVCSIDCEGRHVDPKDVRFTLIDNGKLAGINLFIPNFRDKDLTLTSIGYLLLDEALGEFDVEMKLGLIRILPPEVRTEGDRYPLSELPRMFDQLVSRLEGRRSRPS